MDFSRFFYPSSFSHFSRCLLLFQIFFLCLTLSNIFISHAHTLSLLRLSQITHHKWFNDLLLQGSKRLRTNSEMIRNLHRLSHSGLNMELDLQSLFGLLCTAGLISLNPATPPPPRIWAHRRGRLLVSQDRRHLFVTPC